MGDQPPGEAPLQAQPRENAMPQPQEGNRMTSQRILNKYRRVRKSLEARRADLVAPTDKLHDAFVAVDSLRAEATRVLNGAFSARHMSVDSQVFETLTDIGAEKAAKIANKNGGAGPEDWVRLLRRKYMASESSPFQWHHFDQDHGRTWRGVSIGLRAPLPSNESRSSAPKVEGSRHRPRRSERKEVQEAKESAGEGESENAFLLDKMKVMHSRLCRAGNMNFMDLVLDASSYSKTVENMFVFSNLLCTKALEMDSQEGRDAEMGVTIRPLHKKDEVKQVTTSTVLSLSWDDWRAMREASLHSAAQPAWRRLATASGSTSGTPHKGGSPCMQTPPRQAASSPPLPRKAANVPGSNSGTPYKGRPSVLPVPGKAAVASGSTRDAPHKGGSPGMETPPKAAASLPSIPKQEWIESAEGAVGPLSGGSPNMQTPDQHAEPRHRETSHVRHLQTPKEARANGRPAGMIVFEDCCTPGKQVGGKRDRAPSSQARGRQEATTTGNSPGTPKSITWYFPRASDQPPGKRLGGASENRLPAEPGAATSSGAWNGASTSRSHKRQKQDSRKQKRRRTVCENRGVIDLCHDVVGMSDDVIDLLDDVVHPSDDVIDLSNA